MGRHRAPEKATVLAPLVIQYDFPAPAGLSLFMTREGDPERTMFGKWNGEKWYFVSPLHNEYDITPTEAEFALAEDYKRKLLRQPA